MINKARLNLKDFSEQSQSSLEVCDYRTFIGLECIIYSQLHPNLTLIMVDNDK